MPEVEQFEQAEVPAAPVYVLPYMTPHRAVYPVDRLARQYTPSLPLPAAPVPINRPLEIIIPPPVHDSRS